MPLTSTVPAQNRRESSQRRTRPSSASTMPVWQRPRASSASVGGCELLSSLPGTPIIATG